MDSAIKAGARVIGVNNRNLKDFTVDISNSTRLRSLAPENALFVAESGIKTAEDIQVLKDAGVYKCTEEGRAAFQRFISRVNET